MLRYSLVLTLIALIPSLALAQYGKPIAVAEVKREGPVDFEKDVLPIFKKQCIACHNSATKEGKLVLESPQTILKGGESGPAVVAGKSADSFLLQVASHESEPYMPPKDNKVNAKPLSPQELGVLKLWIDQGATGTVSGKAAALNWQPLPAGVNPIYAVAVTPDGQYIACGRANQIFIYHVASGQVVSRLTDPGLLKGGIYTQPGVAHLDIVQSLAISPDGYTLASGGYQEVKIWQRPTNIQKLKLPAAGGEIASLAVSPDRKLLAVGGADGVIKLVDLAAGKPLRDITGHGGAVSALRFSADNAKLISGSQDKSIRVWNVADGAAAGQIDTPAPVNAIALIGDGTKLASGHADNNIRVYALPADATPAAPEPVKQLTGHSQAVTSLETVPNANTQIVSGSLDGTVRHWNTDNGQSMRQMNHGAPVTSVAARADGQRFASAGGPSAKLWNSQNGQQAGEMKGDYRAQAVVAKANKVNDVAKALVAARKAELAAAEKDVPTKAEAAKKATEALAAAQKTLDEKAEAHKKAVEAKAAADKAAADAEAESKTAAQKAAAAKEAADKDKENKDLAKAKEDADKAAKEAADKAKKAADAATAAAKPVMDAEKPLQDAQSAKNAAQKTLDDANAASKKATDLVPATKTLIETAEAEQKKTEAALEAAKKAFADTEKPIRTVAFSPDNLTLATGGDDNLAHTWNANDGTPLEVFTGHGGPLTTLAFVNENTLATGSADKQSIVWDTNPEWTYVRTIGGMDSGAFVDRVISLDFSPDGKFLATGGGEPSRSGEVKIWNVSDGQLVRDLPEAHSDTVFGLDFSPDGKLLASSAADKFVKVFEVETGKFVRSFEGHTHHVLGVTWKDDGKVLASCGADNVVKVWTFETGEQQRTIQAGFGKQVTSIAFVGDSVNVLTSCGDKTVRLHRADNGQNVRSFSGGTDFMNAAASTPNGKLIVGGGQDSVLWIWNGENGQVIKNLPAPQPPATQQASR